MASLMIRRDPGFYRLLLYDLLHGNALDGRPVATWREEVMGAEVHITVAFAPRLSRGAWLPATQAECYVFDAAALDAWEAADRARAARARQQHGASER